MAPIKITNPNKFKGAGLYRFADDSSEWSKPIRANSYAEAERECVRLFKRDQGTNFGLIVCIEGPKG